MQDKYINFILKKCIYSKSKSIFISYDKSNRDFIKKLIDEAVKIGYEISIEETDYIYEHKLLQDLSIDGIRKHPYFNNDLWNKAAKSNSIFLLASTKFPHYFDDIDNAKRVVREEVRYKNMSEYIKKVSNDEISWTIFGLPNEVWAKDIFPNSDCSYKKLEELIYSFCMIDGNKFDNYIDVECKKANYLNNLNIKELVLTSDKGTNLKLGLVDDYIFRSLEKNHCIENIPTYAVWSMPNKYKTNGIIYGTAPISIGNYLISDYWFEFKDGLVVKYDAKSGKEYLDKYLSVDDNHKRLGEIALIDCNSPIAKTNRTYDCNLFDENISTHLALGMAYKNTIKNGALLSDNELDEKGCNICSEHLDFNVGDDTLRIDAVLKNNDIITIFENGIFKYDLINEKSPFINDDNRKIIR